MRQHIFNCSLFVLCLVIFVTEDALAAPGMRLRISSANQIHFYQPVHSSRYACYASGSRAVPKSRVGRLSSRSIRPGSTVWTELFRNAHADAVSRSSAWKRKVPRGIVATCKGYRFRPNGGSNPTPNPTPAPTPVSPVEALCSNMPAHRWEDVLTNINSVWLACADTAAATLSSQVTPSVIENLLAAAETSATTNGRGIATRILGRFAEQGSGSIAGSLVLDTYRAEIIAQMLERLDVDSGDIILEHAFWVIDSFYYPQLDLKDRAVRHFKYLPNSVALRFRALGVYGRLLVPYYGDTQIPDDEASMFVDGVRDPSPYIRAQAAFVASTLAYSRPPVSAEQRAAILSALSEQFALETETQAKGYIAWALDAFSGSSHYQEMKLEYEAVHLPRTLSAYGITIRSALPLERMQEYLTTLDNLRRAYFNIISPEVVTPIADDPHSSVTLVLFGSIARYREYMSLWGGCCAYAGGVYFEGSATFYTFDRQSWESSFTTPQLVKHEFTHYLNGRHVHPGSFADAGYAFWKRAWQDEGFAEVMAGIEFDSNGDYTLLPHGYHGSAICRSRPTVAPVLNSSFYSTDFYTHSWAMNYFLLTEHKAGLDTIFNAYRDSSYQRDNFSSLAGFSSEAEFESSLNGAIDRWCAAPHAASVQTQDEFQHFDRGDSVSSRGFVSPGSPMLRRP